MNITDVYRKIPAGLHGNIAVGEVKLTITNPKGGKAISYELGDEVDSLSTENALPAKAKEVISLDMTDLETKLGIAPK